MRHLTLALCFLAVASCGPLRIEHDVSGTVTTTVKVDLSPQLFTSFFAADCAGRTQGEQCYDSNPATCAACMSNNLFAYLTTPLPTPSPTP